METPPPMKMPERNASGARAYGVGLARWCIRRAFYLANLPGNFAADKPSDRAEHDHSPNSIFQLARIPEDADTLESPFTTIGIAGAGLMGTTIAARHLARGFRVILYDPIPSAISTAKDRVQLDLLRQVRDRSRAQELLEHLVCVSEPGRLCECPCVIEAVPEDLDTKRQVFGLLEQVLSANVLLLTNTSTIPVARMAAGLHAPERLCGLHFLHPVRERPLVEVIPHTQTPPSVVTTVVRHALKLGKLPILVSDTPGFVVNRLLFAYLSEGLKLLQEGNAVAEVDGAAMASGFAMGPLRIIDEIGLDTVWAAGKVLWDAFPNRVEPSPILVTMMKKRRFGRKVGRGFYRYEDPEPWSTAGQEDPELDSLVSQWINDRKQQPPEDPGVRFLAAMAGEGLCVFAEGASVDPQVIDAAAVFGLGFPSEYGGPLYWAIQQGLRFIERCLARSQLATASGDTSQQLLGPLSLAIRQTLEEVEPASAHTAFEPPLL